MKDDHAVSGGWLKAELHAHCDADPSDHRICNYSAEQLISEAARLGYQVLAITCHDYDVWTDGLSAFAEDLGITLIPGMEVTTEGNRHVLAYNFRAPSEDINTLAGLRRRKSDDTLVVAPHPFFPARSCLRNLLRANLDLFDAIEISGFYSARLDFNRRAKFVAAESHKPLVGNADVHMLWQLGRTYTWIDSKPGVSHVLSAIRQGRVRVETTPLSLKEIARWWATTISRYALSFNRRSGGLGATASTGPMVCD